MDLHAKHAELTAALEMHKHQVLIISGYLQCLNDQLAVEPISDTDAPKKEEN